MDALPSQCKLRRHLSGDTMIFVYLWHLDLLDFSEWAEDKLDILLRDAVGQTSDVHATCCDQTIEVTLLKPGGRVRELSANATQSQL
eukprot:1191153-Prorocentrum_minimum.AAC.4